jgi:type I restriction enzyme S subunit
MSVDLTDVRFLSESVTAYREFILDPGDLLFTRYNGSRDLVGVCGLVRSMHSPVVHPDKLIRVKVRREVILPGFAEIAMNVGNSRAFVAGRIRACLTNRVRPW